jgi:DNA-binding MarR family transcriptional regulator
MLDYNNIYDLFFDHIRKIFYPKEWIAIDLEVSKSELFAMLLVDKHNEIIMSKLSDYINIPMSTATGIVERLAKNGYIERVRNESDRRIVAIILTNKGKTLVKKIKDYTSEYIGLFLQELSDEEKQMIEKVAFKLINVLSKNGLQSDTLTPEEDKIKKIEIQ